MLPRSYYLLYYFKQKEMLAIENGRIQRRRARSGRTESGENNSSISVQNPELNVKPKELGAATRRRLLFDAAL